jgi:hypothetical protein
MDNLVRYCIDIGYKRFLTYKCNRKNKTIIRRHMVSNKDVEKYNLYKYCFYYSGRYEIRRIVAKELSIIANILQHNPDYYFGERMKELDNKLFKDKKIIRAEKLRKI